MLRTWFFLLTFVPWTVLMSGFCALAGQNMGHAPANFCMRLWARVSLWLAGVRLEVDVSALEPGGHYVFMANHLSNFDIPILTAALDRWTVRMVAKESLFRIPAFGYAIRRMGHVPIDRSNPRSAMRSIDRAVELTASGASIVVFPEGTRNPQPDPEALQEFQVGGFVLAIKTGLPVVPVVITGSGRIMPKGSRRICGGVVRIRALAPIPAGAHGLKDRETFKSELQALMNRAYQEIHGA